EWPNLFLGTRGPSYLQYGRYGRFGVPQNQGAVAAPGSGPRFYAKVDFDAARFNLQAPQGLIQNNVALTLPRTTISPGPYAGVTGPGPRAGKTPWGAVPPLCAARRPGPRKKHAKRPGRRGQGARAAADAAVPRQHARRALPAPAAVQRVQPGGAEPLLRRRQH